MKKYLYLLTIGLALFLFCCDKVDTSLEKQVNTVDTATYIRKILLEDYTGHTCGNCPKAAITAESLRELYKEKIVTVAVHVGTFAKPCPSVTCPPNAPAGSYKTDYRTTAGNDYNSTFGNDVAGLPNGMINRMDVNGNKIVPYSGWGAAIANIINTPPDAHIKISNTYNAATRGLNTTIESRFLNQLNGSYKLVVLLTQDSVINWQHNYEANPENVQNYLHRHILRGSLNGSWGESISSNVGSVANKSYSLSINSAWDDSKCSVVAFIYNEATKEVVQAEEKHIR